jgi:hypothetical protein
MITDTESNALESKVLILSPLGGELRLGKKYHKPNYLSRLFKIENPSDIVLLDPMADEAKKNEQGDFILDENKYYTIVTQQDIDEEEDREVSQEDKLIRAREIINISRQFIASEWIPFHKWLYQLSDKHIHPEFRKTMELFKSSYHCNEWKQIGQRLTETGIVHFKTLFSEEFCHDLIEEVDAIERSGLPLVRPNSMNNYGVVLADFGFNTLWIQLLDYLRPMLLCYYGPLVSSLDQHHSFIVKYKMSEQKGLGFHYDNSDLTLNLCLGKKFSGGDLYFKGIYSSPETHNEEFIYSHKIGETIFHLGQHRHGAHRITDGTRYNLIIWWSSSELRKQLHQAQFQCEHHSKKESH